MEGSSVPSSPASDWGLEEVGLEGWLGVGGERGASSTCLNGGEVREG